MGSMVVGSRDFIERFNYNRQMLGGMFRKPGILAQMGIIALETIRGQVKEDNCIARKLSKKLEELGWIEIMGVVETNMIFFRITDPRLHPNELKKFVGTKNVKIAVNSNREESSRLVVHHYIR
jgi:threonine aldolase